MRVRFWGTRGSLPVAMPSDVMKKTLARLLAKTIATPLASDADVDAFLEREGGAPYTFGGNSSCVEIDVGGDDYVLLDMGSGARPFGNAVLATHGPAKPQTYHVLMSHPHWDHIMGFPFFVPSYIPGNTITIYSCHPGMEDAFRRQHGAPSFPVEWRQLGAKIQFVTLEPGKPYEIAGLAVRALRQHHGGDSYGYRLEHDGAALVYSTDSEHKLEDQAATQAFVEFFRDADLVIFDAMYSLADAMSVKEDWGHSSNVVGVELCQMARAKRLCMFHHEPIYDDDRLRAILAETRRFEEITRGDHRVEVSSAYDGLELVLP